MQALPGVDVNSPEVQAAIAEATRAAEDKAGGDKAQGKPEGK